MPVMFMTDEADNILNVIARESHKFELRMISGASPIKAHFPEDIATCCSTRIILGLDEHFHTRMGKIYALSPTRFNDIERQKTALVQIKSNAEGTNGNGKFIDVVLQ